MSTFEKLLLALLVFLIPSNLAVHFTSVAELVQGQLVDYLIPKIYLTDLVILGLILTWLYRRRHQINKSLLRSSRRSVIFNLKNYHELPITDYRLLITLFFLITLLPITFTANPPAALFFWLKLLEMSLFLFYLRSLKLLKHLKLLTLPLTLSVAWQSLLALAQYLKQASVFPYWFLGESQFSATTAGVAKSALAWSTGPWAFGPGLVKVLPYGTTPHPNVLAGFIALSLVMIIFFGKSTGKKSIFLTASKYITVFFGFTALMLTESLSALFVLGLAIVALSYPRWRSTHQNRSLKMLLFLAGIVLIVWVSLKLPNILEPESLSRRLSLNQAALRMIAANPLLGVGLNNFTAALPAYGEVAGSIRFLQPVHNIYLLLAAETGLISFVIVILLLWQLLKLKNLKIENWNLKIPILMMLIIGLADHYP
ncbi:MAG: O-antigen ligase family protein, partial [Candidatus Chisholmbacteria bacterium]|nr:O-antigen ligase family protein [Candidatus Chisholmbacteria bacterium]